MNRGCYVRKVAVLGAGVMGAQIAAHLVNADVEVMLFELAAKGGDANGNVLKAIQSLARLEPSPLASRGRAALIQPANYDEHLERLRGCDLIIEAVAERMDIKTGLYARIAPYIHEQAIFASNTSGLSIDALARALPENLRSRFCGMHFFNPPRYMQLVELIASQATDARVLDRLETFLTTTLGKGVIRAKDTPNFIANRIGVFSIVATMAHTARFGLPLDLVDALTGPLIGRPKSATYRTADVVGLDTLRHVVEGSAQVLKDDPWVDYMHLPAWLHRLIEKGALGQKSGAGLYRKDGKTISVLDPDSGQYRPAGAEPDAEVLAILGRKDPAEKFAALRASPHPQAQFLWAIHRDVFHYAAHWLAEIADNARDLDLAIRWGFGWTRGPFEIWQAAGWRQVAGWIDGDIAAGKTLATTPLPAWVGQVSAVHTPQGSWSAAEGRYKGRSELAVYRRQLWPERVLGEAAPALGETVFENEAVRLWHTGDGIAVLSFKSKMHAIGDDVLAGTLDALGIAEERFRALVIWHPEAPFSAGANLAQIAPVLAAGDFAGFEQAVARFQQTTSALRYSAVPVVAAVQGLALGGGCEFLMHCDHVVAALESYIGLVEVGVGLIPAGGGCKELAQRAAREAKGGDLLAFLKQYFETIAKATVGKSAEEAQELGLLRACDTVIFNPHELLHVAKAQALALAERGYRPPLKRQIPVAGRPGIATLETALVNMVEGGFISEHDYLIGCKLAEALCGGDVEPGTLVSEDWLLWLERKAFVALARTDKTQARITHMLKTGKPLRN
ncbi:MAG TPA: 3-hydroxyacyl-CoA dehydrogenase/enoyl-CoA hydratase family protein [Candidatus Competibacteraceae bacterium]|nr:3-hydroxyacyl-CoA dehydrogenase/enoyl-CoA hydratase family protein [Candidatus Competibacteraceae bacterium]